MYEFLAPWGVFIPIISASIVYLLISEARRREHLEYIQAP